MARELVRFEDYTRREVHDIFSPATKFTPQSGTWGIVGIVPIPGQKGDFVFFVTFGKKQAHHEFDESVTEDGVLSWQSQPTQRLSDPQIKRLINHDETTNAIYLFLRVDKDRDYTYLGNLEYLNHDPKREKPVFFEWQIMDWEIPSKAVLSRVGLRLDEGKSEVGVPSGGIATNQLLMKPPPPPKPAKGSNGPHWQMGKKNPDYAKRDAQNRTLGRAGELLVLAHEKDRLLKAGKKQLADLVSHVASAEGDNAGYDVRSYHPDGRVKFIEVKTTKGGPLTDFFASSNEIAFSEAHPEEYVLYRLYGFDEATNAAECFEIAGPLTTSFSYTPTQFKLRWTDEKKK